MTTNETPFPAPASVEIATTSTPAALPVLTYGKEVPQFCSFAPETDEQRAELYNALNSPDVRISDHVNKEIYLRDFVIEPVELRNETSGELEVAPRVVLIDTDGNSYHGVSNGIYNALSRLCMIYGRSSFPNGLPVRIKQINRGANRLFTLEVIK